MLRFRTFSPIAVVGSVLLCAAGSAQALGYGRVVNASTLGQPLNFAATVRLDADETLLRECVAVEVLSGEARLPAAALRITLEPGADGNERQIRVSTLTQIDEPVVTVNVTAGCQARLTRSFVMLVDPPGIDLAQTGAAPAPSLPPQRLDSTVAPVVAVVEAATAASAPPAAPARRSAAPSRSRAAVAASAAAVRAPRAASEAERPRERRAPAPRVAAANRREGARLQLEAAAPAVASAASAARPGEPAAPAATAAAIAASAALDQATAMAAAASAASAAEAAQRRLATVEESLAQLRDEQQATQKALLRLQASLEQAQATRYSNPMVYGLALLSALLALLVAALWWRQSQTRHASQWWLAPAAGPVPPRPPLPRRPGVDAAGGAGRQETQPAVMDERAVARTLDDLPPPAPPPPVEPPRPAAPPVVLVDPPVLRRELSVEELIDLEQQADFFVVLGQDDAAVDLLMGHVRSSGGASPLPYLKLLEIYRRRGEREAYERIRERFNRRFSAYAPDWDADLMHGKSLDDYPRVLVQLQRLWDEPSRVTSMLDAALMRQDGSAETFDLPAYRELLFLYSIARDLGEHPAKAGAVDLLLPIDGEVPEQPIEKLTASRLMGFAETNQLTVAVDLDVTSALPGPSPGKGGGLGFTGLVDPRLKGDNTSF